MDDFIELYTTPVRKGVVSIAMIILAYLTNALGTDLRYHSFVAKFFFGPYESPGGGANLLAGFIGLATGFLWMKSILSPRITIYTIYAGMWLNYFPISLEYRWWIPLAIFLCLSAYYWVGIPIWFRQRTYQRSLADLDLPPIETFDEEDFIESKKTDKRNTD